MIHVDDFIEDIQEVGNCEENESGEFLCNHGHIIQSHAIQTYIA